MVLLHERPDVNKITMATLVERTGLTERQIRRCIAEELVDGATGKGQGAHYSRKTLRRLQLIRKLQDQKVEPFRRQLTLKEIKSTLDSLTKQQEDQILSGMAFSFVDTEVQAPESSDPSTVESKLDSEFLDIHQKALLSDGANLAVHDVESLRPSSIHRRSSPGTTMYQGDLGDFGMLLQILRDKLERLARDEPVPDQTAGDAWVRVRTRSPMMEIHVKTPETHTERARIRALFRAVDMLIEQGYHQY